MGRKRIHTDGTFDRINAEGLLGWVVGPLRHEGEIVRVEPRDKHGHLHVWVSWDCDKSCPDCHGEPVRHRWDKLKRNEVKSCGRIKRKLYRNYIQDRREHPIIDGSGNPIPATARLKTRIA